jgi:peptide/nickel transport system permease protein
MTTTLTLTSTSEPAWWSSRVVRRFLGHRLAVIGLVMITLLSLACAFGPYLLPFDSLQIDLRGRFAPPLTGEHYLGADALGRDLAARLLMAGRISLLVGFFSMLLATLVGTLVGVLAGYLGGWVNTVLMRTVDGFLSFPTLFLLLALAAALKPSPIMITVIVALTSWMTVARIVATEVASLKEREFVLAARMLGLSRVHIMVREILPNALGPIIVAATLTVARAILLEAYISFLGFGIQPPTPSWGNMLNGAQQYLDRAPWLAIIPGLAIAMAVTSFNFIGDGLRDALDIRGEHK